MKISDIFQLLWQIAQFVVSIVCIAIALSVLL